MNNETKQKSNKNVNAKQYHSNSNTLKFQAISKKKSTSQIQLAKKDIRAYRYLRKRQLICLLKEAKRKALLNKIYLDKLTIKIKL